MSIGDTVCENPEREVWTCPMCYCDHDRRVSKCDECGVELLCTKRRTFNARCEAFPDESS